MKTSYSDEDLTAFIDGEVTQDIATQIRAQMSSDANLRQRITALEIDLESIKAAFDPVLGVSHNRNLQQTLDCAVASHIASNQPTAPSGMLRVASYAFVALLGAAITWAALRPVSDWRHEVAHYQALYVPDTLTSIDYNAARLQTEFMRVSMALDLNLDPNVLSGIDGLELRRAQILGYSDTPLVQVAFTTPDGTPIAFCILKQAGKTTEFESDALLGLASTSWSTSSHRFLMIGGNDSTAIKKFADLLRQNI